MRSGRIKHIALYLCASIFLLTAGWYAHCLYTNSGRAHQSRRVKASGNRLTSPLLDVELPEGFTIRNEPFSFKYKMIDFVKQMTRDKRLHNISVYYRDLGDGPWFGINEHQEFNPASMMKVPVMIAWLKRAEKEPGVLQQSFLFEGKVDLSAAQFYKPRYTLVAGHRYPVEKLLAYMMSFSDNNATSLLYNNLKTEELNAVLDGMDITNRPNEENNSTTVHGYSGFFRILYNASFLNREMSEKALQLLSKEDFPLGIQAGVPEGVTVAAKFGEFEFGKRGEMKQLHEFGIVYHPKGHYILGVMTQGSDYAFQAEIIRKVSEKVYREVDSGATAVNPR